MNLREFAFNISDGMSRGLGDEAGKFSSHAGFCHFGDDLDHLLAKDWLQGFLYFGDDPFFSNLANVIWVVEKEWKHFLAGSVLHVVVPCAGEC